MGDAKCDAQPQSMRTQILPSCVIFYVLTIKRCRQHIEITPIGKEVNTIAAAVAAAEITAARITCSSSQRR